WVGPCRSNRLRCGMSKRIKSSAKRRDQARDVSGLKSEGDLNVSAHRRKWRDANVSKETRKMLEQDAKYFLRQSLSTPCLNALKSCEGIYIEDLEGRRYMDFHGNNVHQ